MNESSLIMAALAVLLAWAAFALHRLRRARRTLPSSTLR